MGNNFLGGLMKGLSGFMPQDDPDVKIMNAQNEIDELKEKKKKIYETIGEKAIKIYGNDAFADEAEKLRVIERDILAAVENLKMLNEAKQVKELEEKAKRDALVCPECGYENAEGTKFCQECGKKLEVSQKIVCGSCGAQLTPGTRFCGECGARQED